MTVKHPHLLFTWALFTVVLGGYLLMAVKFPRAYIVATYEDLVGEWTQVFLFATTMLLSAKLALGKTRERWFFALLALACFYVAGEEISWGQRIFNIATPDFFLQHNQQNETNLHNFFTGPVKSTSKMLLENLLAAGMTGFGLIFPLLIKFRVQFALWLNLMGLAFPPLYLWPFFVASAIFELGLIKFNEAEIAEILIPLAMSLMALNYLLAAHSGKPLVEITGWSASQSRRLGQQSLLLVVVTLLLAGATTAACYSSPRLGPEIKARYLNGMEKFAGRYERRGNWQVAAKLYQQILLQKPERAVVLRRLSEAHKQLGDNEKAVSYLQQAEQADLDFLAHNSLSVAAHLSLAKTYDLMQKKEAAEDHRRGSLLIARRNAKRAPKNSSAAYWVGQALEANAENSAALQAYRYALKLEPGSLRTQEAIQRLEAKRP